MPDAGDADRLLADAWRRICGVEPALMSFGPPTLYHKVKIREKWHHALFVYNPATKGIYKTFSQQRSSAMFTTSGPAAIRAANHVITHFARHALLGDIFMREHGSVLGLFRKQVIEEAVAAAGGWLLAQPRGDVRQMLRGEIARASETAAPLYSRILRQERNYDLFNLLADHIGGLQGTLCSWYLLCLRDKCKVRKEFSGMLNAPYDELEASLAESLRIAIMDNACAEPLRSFVKHTSALVIGMRSAT